MKFLHWKFWTWFFLIWIGLFVIYFGCLFIDAHKDSVVVRWFANAAGFGISAAILAGTMRYICHSYLDTKKSNQEYDSKLH